MSDTKTELDLPLWLARVSHATSRKQLFRTLDEFRPLTWTDNERSQMAKHYIKILDLLPVENKPDDKVKDDTNGAPGDDGPVWYEKM